VSSVLARAVDAATREVELRLAAQEEREIELTQAERWARDPVGWINTFVSIASRFANDGTELPGRKLRQVRMRLFPDQVKTVEAAVDLAHLTRTGELVWRNTAIEKSRQIGETWVFAALVCWAILHHQVTGLAMHTKGGKIDDGGDRSTPESLFGRVRYIERKLDRAALPYLARTALRYRPFSRDPAKIENPANGAVVIGEGQTDNPGRGSTFDFVLGDEFAFVEHSTRVYGALDEACPDGKVLFSTVNGDDNEHARICDERPAGWTYLRLHWSTHPVYSRGLHIAGQDDGCELCAGNRAGVEWAAREPRAHRFPGKLTSPWYDRRVIGKTLEQVANELDIDREGALSARVYREFSSTVHVVEQGIPYEPNVPLELAWDYGLDATSVVFIQDAPGEVRCIGIVELGDLFDTSATPERVAAAIREFAAGALGIPPHLTEPTFTTGWPAIGDPAGHSRDLVTGRPWVIAYRRLGFVIGRPSSRMTRSVVPSINAVKRLLLGTPKPLRICGVKCDALAAHLRNNTWPTDISGHRRLGATTPKDDSHNHACSALRYWCVDRYPPMGEMHEQGGAALEREEPRPDPLAHRRRSARAERGPLSYGSTF
jgi:hypothetical protein